MKVNFLWVLKALVSQQDYCNQNSCYTVKILDIADINFL